MYKKYHNNKHEKPRRRRIGIYTDGEGILYRRSVGRGLWWGGVTESDRKQDWNSSPCT